jgi:hypothetical protein
MTCSFHSDWFRLGPRGYSLGGFLIKEMKNKIPEIDLVKVLIYAAIITVLLALVYQGINYPYSNLLRLRF